MKSFFNILQKCAHSTTITYPDEPLQINTKILPAKHNPNYDFIKVCYVYNIVCKIHKEYKTTKLNSKPKPNIYKAANAKIKVFREIVKSKNSPMFLNKYKSDILNIFSKAQRTYYAFTRLAHLFRLKKYKTVVTEDLSMNPLNITHKNTFILIQNNSKYLFSLNDIVKIIETSVTHAPDFFPEPKPAKNPFNNEPLNVADLYNIYFKMKSSERIMSTTVHLYFLSNFNMTLFALNNEPFLRETTIQKYIYNTPTDTLYKSVITMLKSNHYTRKLFIHNEFPKKTLVDIFKPFLYYYYIINYDIQGTERITKYKNILYLKLKKFYEYNKLFGRKKMHATPRSSNGNSNSISFKISQRDWVPFSFNSNHISFYNILINEATTDDLYLMFYYEQDNDDDTVDDDSSDDDNSDDDTVDDDTVDDDTVDDDSVS
uniref:Uncharacterized protein n=1 Tax=viral metagenome TaxID=1070528 RepID=A0A6C0I8N7_9ZZZZ